MDRDGRFRASKFAGSPSASLWLYVLLIGVLLAVLGILFVPQLSRAQESESPPPDTACKLCHVGREDQKELPSGEALELGVDLEPLDASVHGVHASESVYCTDCHADRGRYRFPHEPNPAQNLAEFSAEISQNCERCHFTIEAHNPGHLAATDNPNLPTCTDCHGGHEVEPVDAMEADPVGTCLGCHQQIGDDYLQSVHEELIANMQESQNCETCHAPVQQTIDTQCKTCHSLLTSELELDSGDTVQLHVDPQTIVNSVHGDREIQGVEYSALQCADCHQDLAEAGFPHPQVEVESRRQLTLNMNALCQDCHQEIAHEQSDGVHQQAIEEGNLDAAVCTDCHGSHDVQSPDEPRWRISQTCGACHAEIQYEFEQSVHGAALLEDNEDVPVCTDCHGSHSIESPLTARFRVESPTLCGGCHADKELMTKYDISTDVFDTYVADFHGTTVTLFEKQSPNHVTNAAVCYDCHGVHNILPATDENSRVIKENLLETCRECHPNASANFPDAWTSHYKPSLQNNTLVFLINQFYAIVIPLFIGGFLVFIGTDVFRRTKDRMRRNQDPES